MGGFASTDDNATGALGHVSSYDNISNASMLEAAWPPQWQRDCCSSCVGSPFCMPKNGMCSQIWLPPFKACPMAQPTRQPVPTPQPTPQPTLKQCAEMHEQCSQSRACCQKAWVFCTGTCEFIETDIAPRRRRMLFLR